MAPRRRILGFRFQGSGIVFICLIFEKRVQFHGWSLMFVNLLKFAEFVLKLLKETKEIEQGMAEQCCKYCDESSSSALQAGAALKHTNMLGVIYLAGNIKCRCAFAAAARVSTRSKQQLEAVGTSN